LLNEKEEKLIEIFNKYVALNDETEDENILSGNGLLKYAEDLSLDIENDISMIIIMFKLGVKQEHSWEISKTEFLRWSTFQCFDISSMKSKTTQWKREMTPLTKNGPFYMFMFDFLSERKPSLSTQEALLAWKLLNFQWQLFPLFEKYLIESKKTAISRDVWKMIIPFSIQCEKTITQMEDSFFPTLIDDFVEYSKKQ